LHEPWPLQAFAAVLQELCPLHALPAVLQSLVPLHEFTPTHAPTVLLLAVLAAAPVAAQPAKISAAAPSANIAPRRVLDVSIDMMIPSKFYDKKLTSQVSIGL
jgi:hypothetical protein